MHDESPLQAQIGALAGDRMTHSVTDPFSTGVPGRAEVVVPERVAGKPCRPSRFAGWEVPRRRRRQVDFRVR